MEIDVLKILSDGSQIKELRKVAENYFASNANQTPSLDERMSKLEENVEKLFGQLTNILQRLL